VANLAFTPDGGHVAYIAVGTKYSDPKAGFFEAKRRGGFLVVDGHESSGWVASSEMRVIRFGVNAPGTAYVVSATIDGSVIFFQRVEVTCQPADG
jgi:hypothetical protein